MGTSTEDLSARAKQLIAERRYQEAVRACRRILLSRPAKTEVRILLGMALLALSRHDEVRAEMITVLGASPEAAVAHRLLGEAHLRDGQVDKAKASLKRSLELDPSDEEARELLTEVAGEDAAVSSTMDRWFDPDAVATTLTELPPRDDEDTGPVAAFPMPAHLETTDLPREATIARASSAPSAPPSAPSAAPAFVPHQVTARQWPEALDTASGETEPATNALDLADIDEMHGSASATKALDLADIDEMHSPVSETSELNLADIDEMHSPVSETSELDLADIAELRPPISVSPYHQPGLASASTNIGVQPAKKAKGSRTRLFLVALVSMLAVVGLMVAIGAFYWLDAQAEGAIQEALLSAEADGQRSSLDQVIGLTDEHDGSSPEDLALRARLQATLWLEHGVAEGGTNADQFLAELAGEELHQRDAIIASTYLALSRGDLVAAQGAILQIHQLPPEGLEGPTGAEVHRAKALVSVAGADYPGALEASRLALTQRPTSPRYGALVGLLEAGGGDIQVALATLDRIPQGEGAAGVRVTRARILKLANSDPTRAATEAIAVLEDLRDSATAPQRGWAHLVKAWHASMSGAPTLAVEEGRAARDLRPAGDEEFALDLAEVFVDTGAFEEAQETLGLQADAGIRTERRARLGAAVALGLGDIEAASAALAEAGSGAYARLMRGRVAEARGEVDVARDHYLHAIEADPAVTVPASARLGAIAAAREDYAEAARLLGPVAEQAPSNVEVVPLLVEALLELDRNVDAEAVVDRAIRAPRPEGVLVAVPFLLARAHLEGLNGAWTEAVATLNGVAERESDSLDVHRSLGEAALQANDLEAAARAFTRVLELAENDGSALGGLAFIEVAQGTELEVMKAAIDRATEAGGEGAFLAQARARVMVLEGKGWQAARTLRRMARHSTDSGLLIALGQAYLQAFKDMDAARAFSRALALDSESPEALLGVAIARTRSGSADSAEESLGLAKTAAEARGMPAPFMARVEAARAGIAFERGAFARARTIATAAIALDEECGDAHMYVAAAASQLNADPIASLRRAVAASPPSVEAMGLLVVEIATSRPSEEVCTLGRRYLAAAPRGFDAREVRRVTRRCR